MLSMLSCQTTTKIVYVVPDIEFPVYPNPVGKTSYDVKTDEVRMPLDYYQKIMEYKLKVDEAKNIYCKSKEVYEGEKE